MAKMTQVVKYRGKDIYTITTEKELFFSLQNLIEVFESPHTVSHVKGWFVVNYPSDFVVMEEVLNGEKSGHVFLTEYGVFLLWKKENAERYFMQWLMKEALPWLQNIRLIMINEESEKKKLQGKKNQPLTLGEMIDEIKQTGAQYQVEGGNGIVEYSESDMRIKWVDNGETLQLNRMTTIDLKWLRLPKWKEIGFEYAYASYIVGRTIAVEYIDVMDSTLINRIEYTKGDFHSLEQISWYVIADGKWFVKED